MSDELDSRGCKRLVAAVVVGAMRDLQSRDDLKIKLAEEWLKGEQARIYLVELDMSHLNLDAAIERAKAGAKLTLSGGHWIKK